MHPHGGRYSGFLWRCCSGLSQSRITCLGLSAGFHLAPSRGKVLLPNPVVLWGAVEGLHAALRTPLPVCRAAAQPFSQAEMPTDSRCLSAFLHWQLSSPKAGPASLLGRPIVGLGGSNGATCHATADWTDWVEFASGSSLHADV